MSDAPGRGVIGIEAEDDSLVLTHAKTGQRFQFERSDLDEVIGTLATFRAVLEASEYDGEDENEE